MRVVVRLYLVMTRAAAGDWVPKKGNVLSEEKMTAEESGGEALFWLADWAGDQALLALGPTRRIELGWEGNFGTVTKGQFPLPARPADILLTLQLLF